MKFFKKRGDSKTKSDRELLLEAMLRDIVEAPLKRLNDIMIDVSYEFAIGNYPALDKIAEIEELCERFQYKSHADWRNAYKLLCNPNEVIQTLRWRPITEAETQGLSEPLFLYSKQFNHPNYNSSGIIDGFKHFDLGWLGWRWNENHSVYETVNVEPTHFALKKEPNL